MRRARKRGGTALARLFAALANQLSLATNGTTLGLLNPAIYNIAVSSCYAKSFHDITTGNNIGSNTAGIV